MIRNNDMMEVLSQHRGDAVVMSTMTATRPWTAASSVEMLDVPLGGAMGKTSSVALGLALAQPDRKIIVLDGDGSLEMNLGTLTTIAGKAPRNLYHFVMENGVYAVTGGQPIPAKDRVSFAQMAKGAGYVSAYEFDDLEDFALKIGDILAEDGPVFVTIKSEPEIQNEPIGRRVRPTRQRPTSTAFSDLQKALGP
jgi:sulfopyruvate decarboxylase subunit beta